jgi:hypothetical protein
MAGFCFMSAACNTQNWRLMAVFYLVLAVASTFNDGKEKFMKHFLFARLAIVIILSSLWSGACRALAPEPIAKLTPTEMHIPLSETPTLQPTATNTSTSVPSKGVITMKPPVDAKDFTYVEGLSMPLNTLTKQQFNKLVENIVNADPFSICPEIWIEAVPDAQVPTFGLFINGSPDDQDKLFAVIIRLTATNVNAGDSISMVTMGSESHGKSLTGAIFSPAEGQTNPKELEIQLVFPGCEIYTEKVNWPR